MEVDIPNNETRETLRNMSRHDLIVLAQQYYINSNQKNETLISQILGEDKRILTKEGKKIDTRKTKSDRTPEKPPTSKTERKTKSYRTPKKSEKSPTSKTERKTKSDRTPKKSEKSSNSGSKTKKSSSPINFNKLPNHLQEHIYKSVIYQEVEDKLEQSKYLDYSNVNVKQISKLIIVNLPQRIDELRRLNNQELSRLIIKNIETFENDKIINLIEPQLIKLQQHLQNIFNNLMEEAYTENFGIDNQSVLELLVNNPDLLKIEHNGTKINLNDYIIKINNEIKKFWNKYKIKIKDTLLEQNVYAQFSINKLISELNDLLEPMREDIIENIPNASTFLPISEIKNNF